MAESIGQTIRKKRKELRITIDGLGQMVGAHAQTIQKIESDVIVQSRYFAPICQALGLDPAIIPLPGSGRGQRTGNPGPNNGAQNSLMQQRIFQAPHHDPRAVGLPVFVSIYADDVCVFTADPVDRQPPPLSQTDGAYSFIVAHECTHHMFKPGDLALVNPHAVAREGDDVVLREKSQGGNFVLAELAKLEGSRWVVLLNGKSHKFEKNKFPIIHRVIGKYSR